MPKKTTTDRWNWGQFTELRKPRKAEKCEPASGRSKTRSTSKRRTRRNMKMRDALKRAGRHRGFSHGKA